MILGSEGTLCVIIQSSNRYNVTPSELKTLLPQYKELLKLKDNQLEIKLPQWIKKSEFEYGLNYVRMGLLEEVDISLGIRIFKLAWYFDNKELQEHAIEYMILPSLTLNYLADTLNQIHKILSDNKDPLNFYKRLITYAKDLMMEEEFWKIKLEITKLNKEIVEDIFEQLYSSNTNIERIIEYDLNINNKKDIIVLFIDKLKTLLEKSIKSIKEGKFNIKWNAKYSTKSQIINKGSELFHLELEKNNKLLLITGDRCDSFNRKMRYRSASMCQNPLRRRLSYLEDSSIFNKSAIKIQDRDIEDSIKLSKEASTIISSLKLNTTDKSKALCLISYIEMGSKDVEAKVNIHYINTMDKKVLIKERTLNKKIETRVPIRGCIFYSSGTSALLEYISRHLKDINKNSSLANLSYQQLIFLINNNRKNRLEEDDIAELVLKWANLNISKVTLERLLKKIIWKNVSVKKLLQLKNLRLNPKIISLIPELANIPENTSTFDGNVFDCSKYRNLIKN